MPQITASPKKIAILGSTGSIGKSTLQVVRHLSGKIQVKALAAKSNIDLLESQAREFHPDIIAVYDKDKALELQKRLPHIKVTAGLEGLNEVASYHDIDFVMSAITGAIGIMPTLTAIKHGKDIGLANKEVLVSAGECVTSLVKQKGVKLLPVDSEHSALFQCLNGEDVANVSRIILTASGGPFRKKSYEELETVTVEDALCHPTWRMGAKITLDCSTLMNKGLEVIEAYWLNGIPVDQIEVVIHPQSVIHSMVEFIDGSMLAQMSAPNMIVPIQYALTYPQRLSGQMDPFDFCKYSSLEFYKPDVKKFNCLNLAYEAIRQGGSLPCFMNAANEVLVERFVNKEIGWLDIGKKLEKLMAKHHAEKNLDIEKILLVDADAREEAIRA